MGYYYDGNYSITYSEAQLVSMYLDIGTLQSMLAEDKFTWDIETEYIIAPADNKGSNSIINIIDYLGWEEPEKNRTREEAFDYILKGHIDSAKYNSIVPILMQWLAQNGVGVKIILNGEDGVNWQYTNPHGVSAFREERLTEITISELERYKKISYIVEKMRSTQCDVEKQKLIVNLLLA